MNDATAVKATLIDWLLTEIEDDSVIASELRYAHEGRRADLAIIGRNTLRAIEIKGPKDDFRKLSRQMEGYKRYFLETYVAVDEDDLDAARGHCDKSVGLIALTAQGPKLTRKASARTSLDKREGLEWLSQRALAHLAEDRLGVRLAERENLEQALASALRRQEITLCAISFLLERYTPKFTAFLAERGKRTTSDDVKLLSSPTRLRQTS